MNSEVSLKEFLINSLAIIDPMSKCDYNWHLELMCDYLEALYSGQIKRLIINVPPRTLKSVCVSVAFPAWILSQFESEKIICASYSQILSIKHSTDCRKVMQSKWYKDICQTRIRYGENEKKKFITEGNGYRFSTSVGGTLTGEGGNVIIVDDPHNPSKIYSNSERGKVISWFENVLMSRLNDRRNGKIVIVMQRLHINDLTGHLLEKSGNSWEVLSIPLIAEKNTVYEFNEKIYKILSKDEILHKSRNTIEDVKKLKNDLGSQAFLAQYQQNPSSSESGIIKKDWIEEFDINSINVSNNIYYSIDTAIGQKTINDYTVIMKVFYNKNNFYILDITRIKEEYPDVRDRLKEIIKTEKTKAILIEDRSLGSSLIQDLKRETNGNIIKINPTKDKITRIIDVLSIIEGRRVKIPSNAEWKNAFIKEIISFPRGNNDDQVDSISQLLNWFKEKDSIKKEPRIIRI